MEVSLSPELAGVVRSLRIYHGDPARLARMDTLHRQFVKRGDLVFDIGAHVGDRTLGFARLGARVIALEPHPLVYRALLRVVANTPLGGITTMNTACGAVAGRLKLMTNSRNPTVATASPEFIEAAGRTPAWAGEEWDGHVDVPCTTLDRLINSHGVPAFVKIDIEGFEDHVLAGLTRAVPALSFEVTSIRRLVALRCIERLPGYEFNISFADQEKLYLREWLKAEDMMSYVHALLPRISGDIYARTV